MTGVYLTESINSRSASPSTIVSRGACAMLRNALRMTDSGPCCAINARAAAASFVTSVSGIDNPTCRATCSCLIFRSATSSAVGGFIQKQLSEYQTPSSDSLASDQANSLAVSSTNSSWNVYGLIRRYQTDLILPRSTTWPEGSVTR